MYKIDRPSTKKASEQTIDKVYFLELKKRIRAEPANILATPNGMIRPIEVINSKDGAISFPPINNTIGSLKIRSKKYTNTEIIVAPIAILKYFGRF